MPRPPHAGCWAQCKGFDDSIFRVVLGAQKSAPGLERRFRDLRDKSGLPPTPERLRQRSEPTLRATALNRCAIAEARLGRGRVNQGGDHRQQVRVPCLEDRGVVNLIRDRSCLLDLLQQWSSARTVRNCSDCWRRPPNFTALSVVRDAHEASLPNSLAVRPQSLGVRPRSRAFSAH